MRKRTTRGRPPRTEAKQLAPLTPLQALRVAKMAAASPRVTQTSIKEALEAKGVRITRSAIGQVLVDRYDNEDVQKMFCELTGTRVGEMFPGTASTRRASAVSG